ncbi:MAG: hypothetical protein PHP23_10670 [Desulfobacterales bacterium]|nr:hypothetical protein [Desulfobacterales bacterium]MDD4071862.1 hypothetical protein [Desulfobacterales bacterium]MDD4391523.1 hypothetical protein [Desulfobacterales bacterium]
MPGKIFYRERLRSKEGERNPSYRIAAVSDLNLKVYADHFRKSELDFLAEELEADIVKLPRGSKHSQGEEGEG